MVCAATPGTARVGPAVARPALLMLCREWQHKPLQRRPYEWSISIQPRKRSNTQRLIPQRSWRWAAMLKRLGWQRHCDEESVHINSVRIIDQCDVTIGSGSHIGDVTIAKMLTFEILSGAAKTTWRLNYKWVMVFCYGEYHQRLNSRPWWQIFQLQQ